MKRSQMQDTRRKVGDLGSVLGAEEIMLADGAARGLRCYEVKNGRGLSLRVLKDRGMDIAGLCYQGRQMAFLSKTGLRHPAFYREEGARGFLKQFHAGLLTTCGLSYAGAAFEEDGQGYGLHGPYNNTPSQQAAAFVDSQEEDVVIRLRGEVKQSQVFGENLVLTREITVETEADRLHIKDSVENQGFVDSPLMLVYHINFGYPLLDAGAKVYTSAGSITPRDEAARGGLARWNLMDEPEADRPEECFFHANHPESAFAMIYNERLGMACAIEYKAGQLPLLVEWKCMREGDYALGLEPTTSGVLGRPVARTDGSLVTLKPGEQKRLDLTLTFMDKAADIQAFIKRSGENSTN